METDLRCSLRFASEAKQGRGSNPLRTGCALRLRWLPFEQAAARCQGKLAAVCGMVGSLSGIVVDYGGIPKKALRLILAFFSVSKSMCSCMHSSQKIHPSYLKK